MKIYVINGPNLNMLGVREPEIYGSLTLEEIEKSVELHCKSLGIEVCFFQSNHEGVLVDKIQEAYFKNADGIIINPAAYTHTSIALLDAAKACKLPLVEVHLSDPDTRECFRKTSYIRQAAIATVKGKGALGYTEAIDILFEFLRGKE